MRPETINAKISILAVSFLAVALILGLSACGGGSSGGSATVTSITLTPTAGTVSLNTNFDVTANVQLSNTNSTNTAVTWQVNGIGGGNSTIGTIVNSPDDSQVGVYTAPKIAPTDNNGQVLITATAPQDPSSTTNTNVVTSNTATITVGAGLGLAVSPTTATVGAGGSFQFSALLNDVADANATWTVSSTTPSCDTCIGSINPTTGLYTAPPAPPPGATVTVTAKDSTVSPAQTATATVTIAFSDQSLSGPFAFSYSGDDESGFMAVAGSFVADGNGHIQSGVEDVDAFSTAGPKHYQIAGTYKVGADGRTGVLLNSGLPGASTWQFALTSNQHALMIRFDRSTTGSGTIDQQNLNDISTLATITGPYVFSGLGADLSFLPMGIAGKFTASGSSTLQTGSGVLDLNDNGVVKPNDTSLTVSYSLDNTAPDTGRGTITLTSAMTGKQNEYAFYIVDSTHLYLVEIDDNDYLAGEMYSGAAGTSFPSSTLGSANYVFTAGGNSTAGAYASGGVFTAAGNSITGGALDTNNAGTVTPDTTLSACTYSVAPSTGRIVLGLCATGASTLQFATYQTAQAASTTVEPAAVMLELDATAVATGSAYRQKVVTEPPSGSFALNLAGQGIFHAEPGSYQQDVEGQLTLDSSHVSSGNLDINDFNAGIQTDPISTTSSSVSAPAPNGRGTAVLVATNPDVSYNLVYYVIDDNTALLFDSDTNRIVIGAIARQF